MAGSMAFEEGKTYQTLKVTTNGRTVFNYGDKVTIIKAIPAKPGHPYNGYIVYSPLTGSQVELREEELF